MRTTVPLPEAKEKFREQCIALARARDEQTISALLVAFGECFDRTLFDKVWREEETMVRTRLTTIERLRKWCAVTVAVWSLGLLFYSLVSGSKGFLNSPLLSVFPWTFYTIFIYFAEYSWAQRRSLLQQGMACLLLHRGATIGDVGYLIDISRFYFLRAAKYKEYNEVAVKSLTQLLPLAAQTDSLTLDEYQRNILRKQIVSVAEHLTGKKPDAMRAEHADFAAAALLAVNALGELRGNSKEHRAAHAAVQKLAKAAPRADEPLNHSYVREVARETLPLLHVALEVKR